MTDARSPITNKPGKSNWVEKAGGLPPYIKRIAEHLKAKPGFDESRAIAVAVNVVKRMCATGDLNFKGAQQVNAASKAEACAAVADWEKKKASAHVQEALADMPLSAAVLLASGGLTRADRDALATLDFDEILLEGFAEERHLRDLYGRFKDMTPSELARQPTRSPTTLKHQEELDSAVRHAESLGQKIPALGHRPGGYGLEGQLRQRDMHRRSAQNESNPLRFRDEQAGMQANADAVVKVMRAEDRVRRALEKEHGASKGKTTALNAVVAKVNAKNAPPGGWTDADRVPQRAAAPAVKTQTAATPQGTDMKRMTGPELKGMAANGNAAARGEMDRRKRNREAKTRAAVQEAIGLPISEASANAAHIRSRQGAKQVHTRSGGTVIVGRQPQTRDGGNGAFESEHPRTRGGKWTIKAGAQGADVRKVQSKVGAKTDGQYGPKTAAAVRAFQKAHGLQVDGIVGHQTAVALAGHFTAAKTAQVGALKDSDRAKLHLTGGPATAKSSAPKAAPKGPAEDSKAFNWRTQGNGKRGVVLKDGTKRVVGGSEFDSLKRRGLVSSKTPRLRGD